MQFHDNSANPRRGHKVTVTSEPARKLLIDEIMPKGDLRLVADLSAAAIATVGKDGSNAIQICPAFNTRLTDDHRITKKEAAQYG